MAQYRLEATLRAKGVKAEFDPGPGVLLKVDSAAQNSFELLGQRV